MFKHPPWASHEGKSKAPNREESLTSVLDAHHCSEFILLIASAAASMRKAIELNFDASVSYRGRQPSLESYLTNSGNPFSRVVTEERF